MPVKAPYQKRGERIGLAKEQTLGSGAGGTACHVNGGQTVADAVEAALGVPEGKTTPDGLFSWEKVACLGCCSLSPVMMINGQAYGKLTDEKVERILEELRRTDGGEG